VWLRRLDLNQRLLGYVMIQPPQNHGNLRSPGVQIVVSRGRKCNPGATEQVMSRSRRAPDFPGREEACFNPPAAKADERSSQLRNCGRRSSVVPYRPSIANTGRTASPGARAIEHLQNVGDPRTWSPENTRSIPNGKCPWNCTRTSPQQRGRPARSRGRLTNGMEKGAPASPGRFERRGSI
jgi:hypothetical protein